MNITNQSRTILALLQLNRLGRASVLSIEEKIDDGTPTIERIQMLLSKSGKAKLKQYTENEIEEALNKAKLISDWCERNQVQILSFNDNAYPMRFRHMTAKDRPVLLYARGDINCLNAMHTVAIIGTRNPTGYGARIAHRLGELFGQDGTVIVSGLARGCDEAGEEGGVSVSGQVVSILPCGIDKIYPSSNAILAERTLSLGGCILSEYPPKYSITKGTFIERDRLQAALSDGVIAVETDVNGGTMHAVQKCMEYGRVLACFVHPEKYRNLSQAQGTQQLIKQGKAMPLRNSEDIEEFKKKISEVSERYE